MAVAVISVKREEVTSLADFANLDEPLYALIYVCLLFAGARWPSLDAAIGIARSIRAAQHEVRNLTSASSGFSHRCSRERLRYPLRSESVPTDSTGGGDP
jgi:hypothetical protein